MKLIWRSFHKLGEILPKVLEIGGTIYCCNFFNKTNCHAQNFNVPENCQYGILYWLLSPELFLYWRVSVFLLHGLSCNGNPMFSPSVNIFLTKTCSSVHIRHSFLNFTWFALLCSSLEYFIWLATILNSLEKIIFSRLK